MVLGIELQNEHGGCTSRAIAKHEYLLTGELDASVTDETKQAIIEGSRVDVTELLSQKKTSLASIAPYITEFFQK